MKDTIISIRIPSSLVTELKELTEKKHFLDLSELIRTVIREKCDEHLEPYKHEVRQMRDTLEESLQTHKESKDKEKLVTELQKIIEELKK